jgi:transcriptional regulator with XRE-family HTH domain
VSDLYETTQSLYRRRRSLNLSQAEVARRMGTTQSAVSDLENGRAEPMVATLIRYADAVGLRMRIVFEIDWSKTSNRKGAA